MLEQLGHALEAGDAAGMGNTMADGVTLRVAVHDGAFEGVLATTQILGVVLDGVLHHIKISETIEGEDASVLMYSAQVAEYSGRADGLLVVRSNEDGRCTDLTVFLRPLAALQALADEMGRRLTGQMPDGGA